MVQPHTVGTLAIVQRLLLVANPASSGFTAMLHRSVVATLRSRFDVTPIWPNGPRRRRPHRLPAADGVEVIAAMGGDGTVHRVANGIVGTEAAPRGNPGWHEQRLAASPATRDAAPPPLEALAASRSVRVLSTAKITAIGTHGAIDRIAIFAAGVGLRRRCDQGVRAASLAQGWGRGPFITRAVLWGSPSAPTVAARPISRSRSTTRRSAQ